MFKVCYTNTDNGVWSWEKFKDATESIEARGIQSLETEDGEPFFCQIYECVHPTATSVEVFMPTDRVELTYYNFYQTPEGIASDEP